MKSSSVEKVLFALAYKSFGQLIEKTRQLRPIIAPWLEQCLCVERGQDWFIFKFPKDQEFARQCLVDDHIDFLRAQLSEITGHSVMIILK